MLKKNIVLSLIALYVCNAQALFSSDAIEVTNLSDYGIAVVFFYKSNNSIDPQKSIYIGNIR